MTCDEVDNGDLFQPCDSSCRADDLFGGSSGISIFCLSIFWQVAFVTMSNVLYLLKASIISHILARWQAIQSHYSQQLQSHLSRSVNVQKAGSGAWWKTRSGHRWLILLLYIPDQSSSSDQLRGLQSRTSPPPCQGTVVLFQVLTSLSGSEIWRSNTPGQNSQKA